MQLELYTDGGCSGNPGCGAWAFVIVDSERHTVLESQSGFDPYTTNNRMELQAVIEALRYAHHFAADSSFALYTDSQYVQKGITLWIHTWMRNNWRSKSKTPIKNIALWQLLYNTQQKLAVQWHWLKGHAEHQYNNQCHELVQQMIKKHTK